MILRSDYIDGLIAEYEAEKSRTARKQQKSPLKRNKLQAELALPDMAVPGTLSCERCGSPFVPVRATGRFCSPRCRVAAYKKRKGEELYARSELRD
jgi:hypothetical protein